MYLIYVLDQTFKFGIWIFNTFAAFIDYLFLLIVPWVLAQYSDLPKPYHQRFYSLLSGKEDILNNLWHVVALDTKEETICSFKKENLKNGSMFLNI